MNKRFLIGLLLFAVVMLVDKLIWPIPDLIALLIEAVALFMVLTGAMQARKTAASKTDDSGTIIPFDPEKQEAIIRCSVCTDEKVAGFKDRETGHFTEVMLIKSPEDEKEFRETYNLDDVRTEY